MIKFEDSQDRQDCLRSSWGLLFLGMGAGTLKFSILLYLHTYFFSSSASLADVSHVDGSLSNRRRVADEAGGKKRLVRS